jgi:hypothetical protein
MKMTNQDDEAIRIATVTSLQLFSVVYGDTEFSA